MSMTFLGGQIASQMQPLFTTQRTCAGLKPCVLLASPSSKCSNSSKPQQGVLGGGTTEGAAQGEDYILQR